MKYINSKKFPFRPTQSIVRDCIFNSLYNKHLKNTNIKDVTFLDLFTGSGNISLEALERGAQHVTSVDLDINAINNLFNNNNTYSIYNKNIEIIKSDAINFLKRKDRSNIKYNTVFADPPYGFTNWNSILNLFPSHLCRTSIILLEMSSEDILNHVPKQYKLLDVKIFNITKIIFLQYKEDNM